MSTSVKLTLAMIVVAVAIAVGALALTRGDDSPTTGRDEPTATDEPGTGTPQTTEPGTTDPGTGESPTGTSDPAEGEGAPSDPPLVRDDSPRLSPGSESTVVEFLDFECPACAGVFEIMEEMRAKYGDRVGFVVRYVPLHANSMNSFRAAEAAREQGRFNDMYVHLFRHQSEWAGDEDDSFFFDYAADLGLDEAQFADDFASAEVEDRINQSLADAQELRVNGTPTFFIEGKQFSPQTVQDLEDAISGTLD